MIIFLFPNGHYTPKNEVKMLKTGNDEVVDITPELTKQCCDVYKVKKRKSTLILGLIEGGKS